MKRFVIAGVAALSLVACESNPVEPSSALVAAPHVADEAGVALPKECLNLPARDQLGGLIKEVLGLKLDAKTAALLTAPLQKAAFALLAGDTKGAIAALTDFQAIVTKPPKGLALPPDVTKALLAASSCLIAVLKASLAV